MGLTLEYVQKTNNGSLRYRRRIPEKLQALLGKTEFVRKLGETKSEAIRRYPSVHNQFERLIAEANKLLNSSRTDDDGPITALGMRRKAVAHLKEELGFDPHVGFGLEDDEDEWIHREVVADQIARKYPEDPETGGPLGVSPLDTEAVRLLRSSASLEDPPPTFTDAAQLYLEEKIYGKINEKQKTNRIKLVSKIIIAALGRDPVLTKMRKKDAREVRDHMLSDRGMTTATVKRYINDIRAIINFGIDQFDLNEVTNPFGNLNIQSERARSEDRRSFTSEELEATRTQINQSASPDLRLIWRLLEGTGCRLGEITGLLVSDLDLAGSIPSVVIQEHPHRRLKTLGSSRTIPLIGDALEAAREAVVDRDTDAPLFARYSKPRGSDRASAALMKHIRKVTKDPKVTNHSLRHLMKDKLRLAGVPEPIQDRILGHSSGHIGEAYGGPEARLRLMQEALEKAQEVKI